MNNLKAIVLEEMGSSSNLKLKKLQIPQPKENEVIVKLKTASINRRDLMIINGQYPGATAPAILGSDGAGEIYSTGSTNSDFRIGDQVIINPGFNWGENGLVKNKDFSILGFPEDGTFAEYVKVPIKNIYKKPIHLSWEEAAALPLAGLTAYRALFTKGKVNKDEIVLIPGAGGGVATFLIQFANAIGAKVFVTSSKKEKIEEAKKLGAISGVNYTNENWGEELLEMTGGVDLTIDSVAGEGFKTLIDIGKIGSRIVNFGSTRGPVPSLLLPMMTLKEMSIIGSTMGSPEDFSDMIDFVERNKIKPIIDSIYPLEEIKDAIAELSNGNNFGKIVLTI